MVETFLAVTVAVIVFTTIGINFTNFIKGVYYESN